MAYPSTSIDASTLAKGAAQYFLNPAPSRLRSRRTARFFSRSSCATAPRRQVPMPPIRIEARCDIPKKESGTLGSCARRHTIRAAHCGRAMALERPMRTSGLEQPRRCRVCFTRDGCSGPLEACGADRLHEQGTDRRAGCRAPRGRSAARLTGSARKLQLDARAFGSMGRGVVAHACAWRQNRGGFCAHSGPVLHRSWPPWMLKICVGAASRIRVQSARAETAGWAVFGSRRRCRAPSRAGKSPWCRAASVGRPRPRRRSDAAPDSTT